MLNNLKVFKNTEFGELEVLVDNGKELFPATECARKLGYTNPYKAVNDHCKNVVMVCTNDSLGRQQEMKYINEGDLFRLIVKSKLPVAEKFEHWVFDEVLPTIRKHGVYATDKVLDEILANPDYGIKLFTELKVEREKRKQLEIENAQSKQIIGELKPKATYYDMILQNKSLMPITQIAKDYVMHTYWTQKGRLFLYDLLKNERCLLPVIERTQRPA